MPTSSATQSKWRQYGPVMLTRCPNCPRPEPLKRLVTKTDDNGNLGREFVKCLSKPMAGRDGKILKKCTHFEWIDGFVQRIKSKGYIDSSMASTWELNLGGVPQMENWGSSDRGAGRVVPMARYARKAEPHLESELTEEVKKIKKNQREMINLQKQANIMAVFFYCCVIALFMFYLLFIVIRGGI
uniref:Zinc finger GRF-type domain-containing protein n=1 Tax=Hordeum vulgare subsp. vulgare TaxID=112509 RepID=A0A8I6YFJ1_HORVV